MDETRARSFVEVRLLPREDPELTVDEIDELMRLAVAHDAAGRAPTDPEWVPTYSVRGLYRAVAEGWRLKYGKAVGRYSFSTDGQRFERGQVLDHIEHQRRAYARKIQTSAVLGAE